MANDSSDVWGDLRVFKGTIGSKQPHTKELRKPFWNKLDCVRDPYLYVLDLLFYSPDIFHKDSHSFNHAILILFDDWLKSTKYRGQLDLDLKKHAVSVIIQIGRIDTWLNLACRIYKLQQDSEEFVDIIHAHSAGGYPKQACEILMALNLQGFFGIDEIIQRVIFNGKNQRGKVFNYVKNDHQLQLELAHFLDAFCTDSAELLALLWRLNVPRSPESNIENVQKTLGKLLSHFKIPISECPNFQVHRAMGTFWYLNGNLKKELMSQDAFEELVVVILNDTPDAQYPLINQLAQGRESNVALAVKILRALKLKPSMWPKSLQVYAAQQESRISSEMGSSSISVWNDYDLTQGGRYLAFTLPESEVFLIDTANAFEECVETLSQGFVIGFDAEWRPDLGCNQSGKLALLQLALRDTVFLLDIPALILCLDVSHWDYFMEEIFCNPEILKLGFGSGTDLSLIKRYCTGEKAKTMKLCQILDLHKFWEKTLKEVQPQIKAQFPEDNRNSQTKGLSGLCHILLGFALNKNEQMSDWERRPLRTAQVQYAALDALCLLQIHEVLSKVLKTIDLDMDTLIQDHFNPKPDKKSQSQSGRQNKKFRQSATTTAQGRSAPTTAVKTRSDCPQQTLNDSSESNSSPNHSEESEDDMTPKPQMSQALHSQGKILEQDTSKKMVDVGLLIATTEEHILQKKKPVSKALKKPAVKANSPVPSNCDTSKQGNDSNQCQNNPTSNSDREKEQCLQIENQRLEKECQELMSNVDHLQQKNEQLQHLIQESTTKSNRQYQLISNLQNLIKKSNKTQEQRQHRHTKEISAFEKEKRRLQSALAHSQQVADDQTAEVEELKESLEILRRKGNDLVQKLDSVRATNCELEKDKTEFLSQIDKLESENYLLRMTLSDLK